MSTNEPLSTSAAPPPPPALGEDVAGLVPALPPVPAVEEVSVAVLTTPTAVVAAPEDPAPPAVATTVTVAAAPAPAAVQEIQGISTSKLLEPIQREAPKLGRKNGVSNLTAAQKLDILHELDAAAAAPTVLTTTGAGGDVAAAANVDAVVGAAAAAGEKSTVTKLAAQYNISRQSIYRWKKEMPRLIEQAKEQQLQLDGGDGMAAALASATRKRGHEETLAAVPGGVMDGAAAAATVDPNAVTLVKKPTGEEYTAQQKLAMVRQLKANSKDGNKLRVREFASKHGVNYRTLYRWIKSEERLVELVEGEGMGSFKRTKFDGHLDRIKEALKVFVAHYTKDEDAADTEGVTKKVTGRIIAEKAIHIKDEMLAQHEVEPFLSGEEVKAMREFTGSQSWGRKMCRRYGWGNSSETTGSKKKGDDDASDDDEDIELNDGGEAVDMTETDDPAKMKLQIKKLKSEVHFLKIKSGKFEKKAAKVETENKSLRKKIEQISNLGATALKGEDTEDTAPSLPPPPVVDAATFKTEPEPTVEVTV